MMAPTPPVRCCSFTRSVHNERPRTWLPNMVSVGLHVQHYLNGVFYSSVSLKGVVQW
ncbi:hypothetical protein HanXRQr2_Chr16g0731641 [Helianthus annuus]|uniref:Uncharacterized protein n=1 Tax=Helianthus annuus TaxID=4232 RepID=A0A251RXI8_HELAN|nr:hypothetical protein HanXRQr2_Chr16g0731641 [Helianthus annuus]KAJ0436961.1 hypothetical protein HanHA300_Chr16g0596531 [Helianthus annuus]KAJ0459273.1 hypothetical protein HanHA89_Chr16g0647021 [Helianthus annuus]